jgi:hypothetical protein
MYRHNPHEVVISSAFAHVGEQVKFDNQFINHHVASDSPNMPLTEEFINDEWMAWCAFDGIQS